MGTILASASGAPKTLFNPRQRSPLMWINPALGVTADSSGNVTQLLDQGSARLVFTQGTPPTRVQIQASSPLFGGQPALIVPPVVAGAASFTSPTAFFSRPQPYTVYGVFWLMMLGGTVNLVNFSSTQVWASFGGASGYAMSAGTILQSTIPSVGIHVVCCVFNGASSVLYGDSSVAPNVTGDAGTGNASQVVGLLGNSVTVGNSYGLGQLLLFLGIDTPAQVAQMFSYLGDYYTQPWS